MYLLTDHAAQFSPAADGWDRIQQLGSARQAAPLVQTLEAVAKTLDELALLDRWLLKVELTTLLPPWNVPEAFRPGEFEEDEIEPEDAVFIQQQFDYAAAVSYLDHGLGALFDELETRGLSDRLLLVLTSDHGQSLAERAAMPGPAPRLHEELIHLPCLIRLPGKAEAGRRISTLTQSVDLLPTLFDAFGVSAPPVHGHNLMPLLLGKADRVRTYAVSGMRTETGVEWALRTPAWSLHVPGPTDDDLRCEPRLYVKPDDRWEVNDVRQHHLEWADRLEETLHAFVEATRQAGPLVPPELPEA
jgi:arylsulfatase A-like enzyme